MPWTVTITEPRRTGADVETTATYSDGAQTLTETYRFASLTQLKQTCINRIAQLTEAAASMASVRAGVLDLAVSTPVEPGPTQAELDARAWLADFRRLEAVRRLAAAGIVAADDARIVALVNSLKAGFKVGYLDRI